LQPQADADMNMDIGQSLQVDQWTGRTGQANYRGAQWSVELLDGHDTALHEFAHILDVGDGIFDGIPPSHVDDHHGFAHALAAGFVRFQELADKGLARRFVMRDYGATNAAEFFAVATEAFFEKPRQLQQKKPEVYRALARFYRIDPLARPGRHGRHRHGRRHRP
jgi:Mlc titration factor MtfA (ptsG expression regulator)